MTPQEKAKELVEKINNELNWIEIDYQIDLYRDVKQCALIAVDEIIEWSSQWSGLHNEISYWQEVKKEIELL
jgi:flavodoxin